MKLREKRYINKIDLLTANNKQLSQSNVNLSQAMITNNYGNILKHADNKTLVDYIKSTLNHWSPLSLTLALLKQDHYSLNLSGIEVMRKIEDANKGTKRLIPSRASVQRFQTKMVKGGAAVVKPTINAQTDIVVLDTQATIEAIISRSEWPGAEVEADAKTLPPLRLDATADGAELTSNRGMILHSIRLISPELVKRVVPTTALQRDEVVEGGGAGGGGEEVAVADEEVDAALENLQSVQEIEHHDEEEEEEEELVRIANAVTQRHDGTDAAAGGQSPKTVLPLGFCHGSDGDVVDGEHNYDR